MVAQISFLVVAGNSFRYYLLIYHNSCAIVSVFWLRQEIVFGCTVSKKDSYLVSLIETLVPYRSTDSQIRSFLKLPELSGQVGISRIPSKNADRKITNHSGKHSFTHSVS